MQSKRMLLLIDENVPKSVSDFLSARGHDVRYVRELLPVKTPDQVIALIGVELSAIVVTWDRDFRRIASRIPRGARMRFRRLGRVSFRCRESRGLGRIRDVIESIEFENELVR